MDEEQGRPWWGVAQRWMPSALVLVIAVVTIAPPGRLTVVGLAVAVVLLVLAWVLSPWFFPRSETDAAARELASTRNVPVIYWRPGCSYCLRLRIALGRAGNRAVWVDISRSDAASCRVREVNGGNETVPTVFVGSSPQVNPSPQWVRDRLKV